MRQAVGLSAFSDVRAFSKLKFTEQGTMLMKLEQNTLVFVFYESKGKVRKFGVALALICHLCNFSKFIPRNGAAHVSGAPKKVSHSEF